MTADHEASHSALILSASRNECSLVASSSVTSSSERCSATLSDSFRLDRAYEESGWPSANCGECGGGSVAHSESEGVLGRDWS